MIDWPDSLVMDLARRRAILFLGSGVSKNSVSAVDGTKRPPTWDEFLRLGLDRCSTPKRHIQTLISQQKFLLACEILKEKLDESWNEIVHETFVDPKFQPAEVHESIFKLDSRVVLTQNVDKIYDAYATTESSGTVYVKDYSKTDVGLVVRGDRRSVLKAHGSVDTPGEMIFTGEEYAAARYQFSRFFLLLDALSVTHTFLFLGCGLTDPDVHLMLERNSHHFPGSRPHYMVTPSKSVHDDVQTCYKRNMNLRFLTYKAKDNHVELKESLKELAVLVDNAREELSKTRDW
ncbi:SIR2 family NAD-dependent protein deacylase [Rhodopirellula baltica]